MAASWVQKTRPVRGQYHFVGLFGGGPDHTTALGGWGAELPGSVEDRDHQRLTRWKGNGAPQGPNEGNNVAPRLSPEARKSGAWRPLSLLPTARRRTNMTL